MISIQSLRDIHTRQPGGVLGGGPSLKSDLAHLPQRSVKIIVNYHAQQFVQGDYLVYMDDPQRSLALQDEMNIFDGLRIGRPPYWSDVDLTWADWWHGNFSSHLATWLACWMGCDPVLLCGMDCYQNERPPDADPRDLAYQTPLEEHLAGWRQAFEKCDHPERIKAISGPLVEIFGKWRN